jgi:uncharacterized membrane protein YdcZ (DUF606 family)
MSRDVADRFLVRLERACAVRARERAWWVVAGAACGAWLVIASLVLSGRCG